MNIWNLYRRTWKIFYSIEKRIHEFSTEMEKQSSINDKLRIFLSNNLSPISMNSRHEDMTKRRFIRVQEHKFVISYVLLYLQKSQLWLVLCCYLVWRTSPMLFTLFLLFLWMYYFNSLIIYICVVIIFSWYMILNKCNPVFVYSLP